MKYSYHYGEGEKAAKRSVLKRFQYVIDFLINNLDLILKKTLNPYKSSILTLYVVYQFFKDTPPRRIELRSNRQNQKKLIKK